MLVDTFDEERFVRASHAGVHEPDTPWVNVAGERKRNGMAQRVISPVDQGEREQSAAGGVALRALLADATPIGSPVWRLWMRDGSSLAQACSARHLCAFPLLPEGDTNGADELDKEAAAFTISLSPGLPPQASAQTLREQME
jgi:hypothetical protein